MARPCCIEIKDNGDGTCTISSNGNSITIQKQSSTSTGVSSVSYAEGTGFIISYSNGNTETISPSVMCQDIHDEISIKMLNHPLLTP